MIHALIAVAQYTDLLNYDELLALNICVILGSNPRNKLFDYNKVAGLFTEENGNKVHGDVALAIYHLTTERAGAL